MLRLLAISRRIAIVLCLGGVLFLVGCGGASSAATGGSSSGHASTSATSTTAATPRGPVSNICPLVTPAQLHQITGITYNSGIVIHPGGSPAPGETGDAHCGYQQTVNVYSNVGDSALWFGSAADANTVVTTVKTNYANEGANPNDVAGVGDKAFSFRGGLVVLSGNVVFVVTFVSPTTRLTDVGVEKQIAAIVLPQL